MRLLLDTHALVWYYQGDLKLSAIAIQAIQDPKNDILISPASYWEVAIKISVQKPILQVPYAVFIQEAINDNGFTILPKKGVLNLLERFTPSIRLFKKGEFEVAVLRVIASLRVPVQARG